MIVELLGVKIIAPYYGTSLYVWSSVLGVTLGALALGYFFGGQISRKYPGEKSLFIVLLFGGFLTVIAPLIAPKILLITDPLGVKMGSLLSVSLYLLAPISCLGSVSPIIIQLINKNQAEAGKSAGTVYAISTVGGILATFLAGFYLIPTIGIYITAFTTGGLLGAIALLYFMFSKNNLLLLTMVFMTLIAIVLIPSKKLSDNTRIVYQSTGILGEWTVVDFRQQNAEGKNKIHRKLLLNGIDQTNTQLGYEPLSLWEYPHKIAAYSSMKPRGSKALLLGMGGGSIAHELLAMGLDLDIVELDERIIFIAKEYFNYNAEKSNLYIDDARHFIRTTKEIYDVVVIDLVIGEIQPAHIFSLEGLEDLKKIINNDALVIINFQGNIYSPAYSLGPRSIYRTLLKAGFNVKYYSPNDRFIGEISLVEDIYFLASLKNYDYKSMMEDLRYNAWFKYDDFYYEDLITDKILDLSNAYVLVDDKPKLDLINSASILQWRQNKIQEHIQKMIKDGIHIYN